MTVCVVTCVSNKFGAGPGHSCVDINETIYTFEAVSGAWLDSSSSGWKTFSRTSYLNNSDNLYRPVIFQQLKSEVDTQKALDYIKKSQDADEDYVGSGVCSSQVADLLEAASGRDFDTWGIDKPYEVYQMVKERDLVSREWMIWAKEDEVSMITRNGIYYILGMLKKGYSWAVF